MVKNNLTKQKATVIPQKRREVQKCKIGPSDISDKNREIEELKIQYVEEDERLTIAQGEYESFTERENAVRVPLEETYERELARAKNNELKTQEIDLQIGEIYRDLDELHNEMNDDILQTKNKRVMLEKKSANKKGKIVIYKARHKAIKGDLETTLENLQTKQAMAQFTYRAYEEEKNALERPLTGRRQSRRQSKLMRSSPGSRKSRISPDKGSRGLLAAGGFTDAIMEEEKEDEPKLKLRPTNTLTKGEEGMKSKTPRDRPPSGKASRPKSGGGKSGIKKVKIKKGSAEKKQGETKKPDS